VNLDDIAKAIIGAEENAPQFGDILQPGQSVSLRVAGVQGVQGDHGDKGDQGDPGRDGLDSTIPGPQGLPGQDGADSTIPGPLGLSGKDGADSTVPGPKGDKGSKGDRGEKGDKGDTGSAGGTSRGIFTGGRGGGSGALAIEDEGVSQGTAATLNVAGAGASVAVAGGVATLTVPGGGGETLADVLTAGNNADSIDIVNAAAISGFLAGPGLNPSAVIMSGGKNVVIQAADGLAGAKGGNLNLYAGAGDAGAQSQSLISIASTAGGVGGDILITPGDALEGSDQKGGSIVLGPGSGDGAGPAGDVLFSSGTRNVILFPPTSDPSTPNAIWSDGGTLVLSGFTAADAGATWRDGSGAPSNTLGADGDYYLDNPTGNVYLRTSGTYSIVANIKGATGTNGTNGINGTDGADGSNGTNGTNGTNGSPGTDGKTVLYGTVVPTTEGVDGDFYIRTTTNYIYGPKASGTWPAGTSLVGPTGATGATGSGGSGVASCRVATAAVLSGTPTYANGSSGVGATLTEVGFGALTVDGVAVAVNDRVLVKNQADPKQNGIYVQSILGTGLISYVLTRATDYDSSTEIFEGTYTIISEGTAFAGTIWQQTTSGTITVGSTNIVFGELQGEAVSTATPVAVGTAAAGTSPISSNQDHVHATGAGTPSTQAFGDAAATGTGPAAAMTDHKHAMPAALVGTINFIIDGGGAAITAGVKGDLVVDFACTITGWDILADQAGSIVVDIWNRAYANFPPTVTQTITGAESPTLSSAAKNQNTAVNSSSGWTIAAGSTLRFNANATPATVTRVTVALKFVRT
jgi:hypothetical protein